MRNAIFLVGLGLLAAHGPASAAMVMESENTNLADQMTVDSTIMVDTDRMKVVSGQSGGMIFRADLKTMWMLDPAHHAYREMNQQSMQQASSQMNDAMAKMQAQLQSMPEAQRKQFEAAMAQHGGMAAMGGPAASQPQEVTYDKAGSRKTIGQWSCEVYHKRVNGQLTEDDCITPASEIGFTADDLKIFKTFSEQMQQMMPNQHTEAYSFDAQRKALGFDGFPVEAVHMTNGQPSMRTVIKAIDHKGLPADTFEIPAGYTKQDMPH